MENKKIKPGRRGFLFGLLTGAGAATAALAGAGSVQAKTEMEPESQSGPILYQRNEESERYYKTLYT